ncbi:hypothetical protein F0241_10510 [Vibrio kanaloae]|uniref:hypothetical protein n=1 Tax=Vibrio TaxID=662 RepID=UPI000A4F5F22|nr:MULTISPECIES: hypothetical protein [Vibrio]NOI01543.1 hypothetical protein [Vibrio kanaloae]TKE99710.1 hypothetical protein FCV46_18670 [Vibrio kanaloae]
MNNTGYCRVDHEAGKTGFIETVIIENLVFYYDRLLVLIVVQIRVSRCSTNALPTNEEFVIAQQSVELL